MKKAFVILLVFLNITFLNIIAQDNAQVLVLIHIESGGTYQLAKSIAKGIGSIDGVNVVIKQVPSLADKMSPEVSSIPIASIDELPNYNAIAFGSPVYFGGMSSSMKHFLEESIDLWGEHELQGIPATVFMSAGSGAGRELAIQSFWSTLALHGMLIVPTGIMGTEQMDKTIPQGNTVLGVTSRTSMPPLSRPSKDEIRIAELQGAALAKQALANRYLKSLFTSIPISSSSQKVEILETDRRMKDLGIILPPAPDPVGNYVPYKRVGNLIFINQVSLVDGKIMHPGIIGKTVSEEDAKAETKQAMLNVIAVLKQAVGGNLDCVKQAVQVTGMFNTEAGYTRHAVLMNEASNLLIEVFEDRGKHTRATLGTSSLPVDSSVELQAIFEVE